MTRAEDAARRLVGNWNARAPYEPLQGDLAPGSAAEAYKVQLCLQGLHAPRRGAIGGRKIALSSKTMQQMVGMDQPVAGGIFAGDIAWSPARIALSDFVRLGLEFELAIELNADVPPKAQAYTADTAHALIGAVRPAFELIEDRNADYSALDPMTLIADNAWCGGVVLGEALENWRDLDLGDIPSVVRQSGQPDEAANTGAADPLGSLAWVLNHYGGRGIGLSKGEHIITGSAVRTRFPAAGDSFAYEVAGAAVRIEVI